MPTIGYGTWQTPDGATTINAVRQAIEAGYRHIDGAAVYANEKSVGIGIAESGIQRKELFITSKLWNTQRGYDTTLRAFEQTLADLRTDYLDLYLIHWPANALQFPDTWQKLNSETWRAFERLADEGAIKSIGLSNFLPHHIDALNATANIAPAVNQIEFHPGVMQMECVEYCQKAGIVVEAWSPLGSGRVLADDTLRAIADKYGKSVAQICIRWVLQHNVAPLPKSTNAERMAANLQVYDFELSSADMQTIDSMPLMGYSGSHPDKVTF